VTAVATVSYERILVSDSYRRVFKSPKSPHPTPNQLHTCFNRVRVNVSVRVQDQSARPEYTTVRQLIIWRTRLDSCCHGSVRWARLVAYQLWWLLSQLSSVGLSRGLPAEMVMVRLLFNGFHFGASMVCLPGDVIDPEIAEERDNRLNERMAGSECG